MEEALCMAGENGRPHQAALVRALRKHPSYWTRPTSELLRGERGRGRNKNEPIDMDESLPSNEDTTTLDDGREEYVLFDYFFVNGIRLLFLQCYSPIDFCSVQLP